MSPRLVAVLCVACAFAVGNVYFPQTVTPLVAAGLDVSPADAGLAVTATQLGYTAGMLLVVPLCDRVAHRSLLVVVMVASGVSLLVAGCAPNLPVLVAASAGVGLTTVAAPVSGPLVARLAGASRGEVMGTMLSGCTGGMLAVRAVSGSLGEWYGWRVPYLAAAAVTLVLAVVLWCTVPVTRPTARQPYPALLAESLRLLRTEPELRRSCAYQAAVFAGFSAVWACVALLLTGDAYGLGADSAGLLALVGAATMLCAPLAGRWIDRRGPDVVNLVCFLGVLAAAALLGPAARGGLLGLVVLVAGTLVLDVAMQCGMVANQARMYAVRPEAGGRLNTAYMTCAYTGGTAGSFAGLRVYDLFGWAGVCALVGVLAAVALTGHLARSPAQPSHQRADG